VSTPDQPGDAGDETIGAELRSTAAYFDAIESVLTGLLMFDLPERPMKFVLAVLRESFLTKSRWVVFERGDLARATGIEIKHLKGIVSDLKQWGVIAGRPVKVGPDLDSVRDAYIIDVDLKHWRVSTRVEASVLIDVSRRAKHHYDPHQAEFDFPVCDPDQLASEIAEASFAKLLNVPEEGTFGLPTPLEGDQRSNVPEKGTFAPPPPHESNANVPEKGTSHGDSSAVSNVPEKGTGASLAPVFDVKSHLSSWREQLKTGTEIPDPPPATAQALKLSLSSTSKAQAELYSSAQAEEVWQRWLKLGGRHANDTRMVRQWRELFERDPEALRALIVDFERNHGKTANGRPISDAWAFCSRRARERFGLKDLKGV